MSKTRRTFANAFGSKEHGASIEYIERITIETRVVQEQKAALKSCRGKLKSIL